MKNPLVIRVSRKNELVINWKGYVCAFRGDHYPINFTTLKCETCGKQFRFIPMEEYLGKVAPRVGAWIETEHKRNIDNITASRPAWARGLKQHI